MEAYIPLDTNSLNDIDYTGARVKHITITIVDDPVPILSPSFQDLRKWIFKGIETRELLSGVFSTITDDPTKGSSFKQQDDFCAWKCSQDYKYEDGERITVYIRNSSANEIMRDVFTALSGPFNFPCEIEIVLKDGTPITIRKMTTAGA